MQRGACAGATIPNETLDRPGSAINRASSSRRRDSGGPSLPGRAPRSPRLLSGCWAAAESRETGGQKVETVVVVLLVVAMLGLVAALISAFVSALRVEPHVWRAIHQPRGITLLLILFTGGVGGVYYWWRIRPQLQAARQQHRSTSVPNRAPTASELRAIAAKDALGH